WEDWRWEIPTLLRVQRQSSNLAAKFQLCSWNGLSIEDCSLFVRQSSSYAARVQYQPPVGPSLWTRISLPFIGSSAFLASLSGVAHGSCSATVARCLRRFSQVASGRRTRALSFAGGTTARDRVLASSSLTVLSECPSSTRMGAGSLSPGTLTICMRSLRR